VSDDSIWLKFIISEIAEAAPWEDKSAPHAAAHIRNLILNLKTEANMYRKLYENEKQRAEKAEAAEDLLASLETVLYTDMLREEEVLPTIYDLMKEHGYKGPTSLENS
jgi:hypothetical protein